MARRSKAARARQRAVKRALRLKAEKKRLQDVVEDRDQVVGRRVTFRGGITVVRGVNGWRYDSRMGWVKDDSISYWAGSNKPGIVINEIDTQLISIRQSEFDIVMPEASHYDVISFKAPTIDPDIFKPPMIYAPRGISMSVRSNATSDGIDAPQMDGLRRATPVPRERQLPGTEPVPPKGKPEKKRWFK